MSDTANKTEHRVDYPEIGDRSIFDSIRLRVDTPKLVQPITPVTINIKDMRIEEQYNYLKVNMNYAETTSYERSGQIAAYFRGYVKKGWLKLDGLFEKYENFMNVDLRNFLNLNEQGKNEYSFSELNKHKDGWSETPSVGAQFHQTEAPKDQITYYDYHVNKSFEIKIFNKLNAKFTNDDGREAVFNYKYELITKMPDMGTFNYANAIPHALDHKKYDVDEFYKLKYWKYNERNPEKDDKWNGLLKGNSYYWQFK